MKHSVCFFKEMSKFIRFWIQTYWEKLCQLFKIRIFSVKLSRIFEWLCVYFTQLQCVHRTVVLTCVGKCLNFTPFPLLSQLAAHDINCYILLGCPKPCVVFVFLLWQWHDIGMTWQWHDSDMTVTWQWHDSDMTVTWQWQDSDMPGTYGSEMNDSGSIGVINACM